MSEHRGTVPPLPDPVKVEVVANRDRVRLTDSRLLVIFVLLMVILGGAGTYVKAQFDAFDTFRQGAAANCQNNRDNTLAFNAFITKLQAVTLGTPLLSDKDRRQRIAFYQAGKQRVPRCPLPPSGKVERGDTDPPSPPPTKPLKVLN